MVSLKRPPVHVDRGVLWAGLRVAMWITHVGSKFRHGLLEKSLIVTLFVRSFGRVLRAVFRLSINSCV